MTLDRRRQEIELLRRRYGELENGENLDWVLFKSFPLPVGLNSDSTELLVLIPAGYPITPPDNFYVRNGLRTTSGGSLSNYSENQSILGGSWAQFSFHAKEWSPSSNSGEGDSLITFMFAVEGRLKELN